MLRELIRGRYAIAPGRMAISILVMLAVSLTEGAGLLMLLPLLALVGVGDPAVSGAGVEASVRSFFADVGIRPSLEIVLGFYVLLAAFLSILKSWDISLRTSLQHDVVATLRVRLYNAIARARWEYLVRTRMSRYTNALTAETDRVGAAISAAGGLLTIPHGSWDCNSRRCPLRRNHLCFPGQNQGSPSFGSPRIDGETQAPRRRRRTPRKYEAREGLRGGG
jgi:hypothetical protein